MGEWTEAEKADHEAYVARMRAANMHEEEVGVWERELIRLASGAGSGIDAQRGRVRQRLAVLYTTGPEGWR
jgi:hypothetical protein